MGKVIQRLVRKIIYVVQSRSPYADKVYCATGLLKGLNDIVFNFTFLTTNFLLINYSCLHWRLRKQFNQELFRFRMSNKKSWINWLKWLPQGYYCFYIKLSAYNTTFFCLVLFCLSFVKSWIKAVDGQYFFVGNFLLLSSPI